MIEIEHVNFSVELNEAMNTQMRVIDINGKVILKETFNRKNIHTQIDLTDFPSGVYYIEFGSGNTRLLEKFVVVRQCKLSFKDVF